MVLRWWCQLDQSRLNTASSKQIRRAISVNSTSLHVLGNTSIEVTVDYNAKDSTDVFLQIPETQACELTTDCFKYAYKPKVRR